MLSTWWDWKINLTACMWCFLHVVSDQSSTFIVTWFAHCFSITIYSVAHSLLAHLRLSYIICLHCLRHVLFFTRNCCRNLILFLCFLLCSYTWTHQLWASTTLWDMRHVILMNDVFRSMATITTIKMRMIGYVSDMNRKVFFSCWQTRNTEWHLIIWIGFGENG